MKADSTDGADSNSMDQSKGVGTAHVRQESGEAELIRALFKSAQWFKSSDEGRWISVRVNGHIETHEVKGEALRQYVISQHFEQKKEVLSEHQVTRLVELLDAHARFSGDVGEVYTRVAATEGAIYIDLGRPSWDAVEVTASGWRVVDDVPVRFRRPRGTLELPSPDRGGCIDELRQFVNVDDRDFPLVVAFIMGALRGRGPFALLEVLGFQGSAKTTMCRVLQELIDPRKGGVRGLPQSERDFAIASSNSWCMVWDNLSRIVQWQSDVLCRLATGGAFATRHLYTDADEKLFELARPCILNSIVPVATRPDLIDRTLILRCPVLPPGRRQTEHEFWRRFDESKSRIFGALLDGLVVGLREFERTILPTLPRLADFAQWATAAEKAFWSESRFMNAYQRNRRYVVRDTLEKSSLAQFVIDELARCRVFEGTATELFNLTRDVQNPPLRDLPGSPAALGSELRRLAPFFEESGYAVEFDREGQSGKRVTRISCPASPSAPSAPSQREVA